jgi:hypothetical protein
VENVLGRLPLIPCYLNGNSVNTIPHCFRGKIPREAAADSRLNSGTGGRLFKINMWMSPAAPAAAPAAAVNPRGFKKWDMCNMQMIPLAEQLFHESDL